MYNVWVRKKEWVWPTSQSVETSCCCQAVPKCWWRFIQAIKSSLKMKILNIHIPFRKVDILGSNNSALIIFVQNNPQRGRSSAQLRQQDLRVCRVNRLWAQPVGISLAPQRHWLFTLREAAAQEQQIGLHSHRESGIISARIWVFIWGMGRGMLTSSPVSGTEKGLFAERKPLCRRGGLGSWLYTQGKHERDVGELKPGEGRLKKGRQWCDGRGTGILKAL